MVNILVIAGIVFIYLAFRKGRMEAVHEQKELQELKQVRDELTEAKKEVGSLLEQLEVVSEKVVEEISAKVEEVKLLENTEDAKKDVPAAALSNTDHLPGEDIDEEFEAEAEDEDEDEDYDESVESFRNSIDKLKQKSGSAKVGKGKTIIFPHRKPDSAEPEIAHRDTVQREREVPPKHQMVYAMAKLGYSEEEIAKQMKMGKGEVSLMLQLKRKGEEANG